MHGNFEFIESEGVTESYKCMYQIKSGEVDYLLLFGLPLGELTMGGQYRVFPKKLKMLLVTQLVLQIFFVIILQMGGYISLWFSYNVTRIICILMAVYLSLNTVINFISKSKKEKYIITPLSFVTAICFWITAL